MPEKKEAKQQPAKNYNQKRRRKAEFIRPPNTLKAKVGSGGLGDDILKKAQALLENNAQEFLPLAEMYLASLMRGVEYARQPSKKDDQESLIAGMIYPAMQLKANGGMFQYPLITKIADKLVQFLEVIIEPDIDALEIVIAFHATMRAVVTAHITGSGGEHGQALLEALEEACFRYFERYTDNRRKTERDYDEFF